ncbi:MAG: transposase, partial [Zoogloeaceae bacterium]|nr:transposase [Zoogloeaceae bacterium]
MSELRKLRQLEDENNRLRRIVADLTLDKQILQEVVKKALKAAKRRARDQSALQQRIRDIALSRPRFGYLRVLVMLQREGWRVGKKRVYRLYRMEGLQL